VRVIDGDTVEIYINGHQTGIGIVGIKAPEGNTPCGRQASAYLAQLLSTKKVRLEDDPITPAFDKKKRRMFRLVLSDGRSAAVALAEGGFARPDGGGIEANDIAAAAGRANSARVSCVSPANGGSLR
jgi:endonuclease YncB( thermonuclease family)